MEGRSARMILGVCGEVQKGGKKGKDVKRRKKGRW